MRLTYLALLLSALFPLAQEQNTTHMHSSNLYELFIINILSLFYFIVAVREKEPIQKFDSNPAKLEKLLGRLESVVSRLEKVAGCFQAPSSPLVTSAPESTASESLTNSPLCQTSPLLTMSLAAYQDIINVIYYTAKILLILKIKSFIKSNYFFKGPLERFMQYSAGLQHVQEQAALVKQLFK